MRDPVSLPARIITKSRHVMRAELWRPFGIGMVILVLSVGCATKIPIDPHPLGIEGALNVGDTVEITTTSGSHHRVRVNDITEDAIIGDGHPFSFNDIATLAKIEKTGEEKAAEGVMAVAWLGVTALSAVGSLLLLFAVLSLL